MGVGPGAGTCILANPGLVSPECRHRSIKGRYSNLRHIIHKGLNKLKRTISV